MNEFDAYEEEYEDEDRKFQLTLKGILFLGLLDWLEDEEKSIDIAEALVERVRDYAERMAGEAIPAVLFHSTDGAGHFVGVEDKYVPDEAEFDLFAEDEEGFF